MYGIVCGGEVACFVNSVYEVSGVNGSVAQGGQIGADGSGPVRAMCSGVEGGGGGFEREGV